jgi:hypothetical protein
MDEVYPVLQTWDMDADMCIISKPLSLLTWDFQSVFRCKFAAFYGMAVTYYLTIKLSYMPQWFLSQSVLSQKFVTDEHKKVSQISTFYKKCWSYLLPSHMSNKCINMFYPFWCYVCTMKRLLWRVSVVFRFFCTLYLSFSRSHRKYNN